MKLPPEPDLLGDALEENRKLRADARRLRKAAIALMEEMQPLLTQGSLRQFKTLLAAVKQSQRTEES